MGDINNIFICITPLQMMIAERIILNEKLNPKESILIALSFDKSKKQQHYYNKIKPLFSKAFHFNINFNGSRWLQLKHHCLINNLIATNLTSRKGYNVYFASINDKSIHQICSKVIINTIFTFDDGTANINKNGVYFDDRETLKSKLLNFIFSIKKRQKEIKKTINKHYTIYPDLENIVDKNKLVGLDIWHFISNEITHVDERKVKRIFLGQPFDELNLDIEIIIKKLNELSVTNYFPHPREKHTFKDVTYIESSLIFEDYIYCEIEKNPNIFYEIYSINSTALLNIISLSRSEKIGIYYLYNNDLKCNFQNIYDIFDSLGISAVELLP
ncbi:glycosyltransferase family 52 [Pectobacterium atrosepticum]|uniref:glycosyltransferase family 52 n=1 Tax=Pectobacterium atrosepticum TaxID=29471 RepID=UPI00039B0235|nr:glycosyltransferase family 52 [Pectobacterium atrosepticum]